MDELLELSFEVDGKTYNLTPPNPRIAFQLSRAFGGVALVLEQCQKGDLDAYFAILRFACPAAPKKERELQEFVFANVPAINFPLSRYAQALQYGGRTPPSIAQAIEEGEADADETAAEGAAEGNVDPASVAEDH